MLVIYRADSWPLLTAPQSAAAAWRLADRLTRQTGIAHYVGRI